MTELHRWEDLSVQDQTERRQSVPGGWIYWYFTSGREAFVYVPDPTAPHCQPTPPADDRIAKALKYMAEVDPENLGYGIDEHFSAIADLLRDR